MELTGNHLITAWEGRTRGLQRSGYGAIWLKSEPLFEPWTAPAYVIPQQEEVISPTQLETLRRQISVYATICQQLIELHKAAILQQGYRFGEQPCHDQVRTLQRTTSRQRWNPSQTQLQILKKVFDEENATPSKQRIKEIVSDLSEHGQVSETNVYNWFQNRKARVKRKHGQVMQRSGASEEAEIKTESPGWKRMRRDDSSDNSGSKQTNLSSGTPCSDQDQCTDFHSDIDVTSLSSYGRGAFEDNNEPCHSMNGTSQGTQKISTEFNTVRKRSSDAPALLESGIFLYATEGGGAILQPLGGEDIYPRTGLQNVLALTEKYSFDGHHYKNVAGF